jgi:kumamolisin
LLYKHKAFNGVLTGITEGSNNVRKVNVTGRGKMNVKGYRARNGWDACTGLGRPNGFKLLNALKGNNFED